MKRLFAVIALVGMLTSTVPSFAVEETTPVTARTHFEYPAVDPNQKPIYFNSTRAGGPKDIGILVMTNHPDSFDPDSFHTQLMYDYVAKIATSIFKEGMTTDQKVMAIGQWISHIEYANTSTFTRMSAKAFIYEDKAECLEIAWFSHMLLSEAGIRSVVVDTATGKHAWVEWMTDDKSWVQFDPTSFFAYSEFAKTYVFTEESFYIQSYAWKRVATEELVSSVINAIGINDHGYFVAGHYSPEGDPFDPKNVSRFSDVSASSWYFKYVDVMARAGYVSGNNGKFMPESNLSVYEAVTMLAKAGAKWNNVTIREKKETETWYAPSVEYMVKEGYCTKEFFTDRKITREEICYLMGQMTYGGAKNPKNPIANNASPKYRLMVLKCYENGLITGNSNGLNPKGSITRAEMARMYVAFVGGVKLDTGDYEFEGWNK